MSQPSESDKQSDVDRYMKMSGEQRVHAMIGHFAELAKSPEMMACLPPYHPRQETLSGTLLTPITLPSTGMDQTPLPPSPGALRLVPRRTSPLGDLHFHRAAAALQRPTEPPYVPTYLTPFHPASTNPTPQNPQTAAAQQASSTSQPPPAWPWSRAQASGPTSA
jgi:hypothetical protein